MTDPGRIIVLTIAAALVLPALASAQAPFDMSPERRELAPTPTPGGGVVMPFNSAPAGEAPGEVSPTDRAPAAPAAPTAKQEDAGVDAIDRYIIPQPSLRFEGEMGRRSWGVALTADQAARPTTLAVTYNSSIYVAPENSRLRVLFNDQVVLETPLKAREKPGRVTVPVPSGNLKAGINRVSFEVVQRHRTDCTVQSTYDLWTEIEGEGTGLIFDGADPQGLTSLDDLAAVGFDATGTTNIRLVLPDSERSATDADILGLVQAIALRGDYPQPSVRVTAQPEESAPPGTLQVAVGTARALGAIGGLPANAEAAPTVAFVAQSSGTPNLVVTGPDPAAVAAAVHHITAGVDRPLDVNRTEIDTTPWLLPQVPMLGGKRTLSFADLAVPTEEFNGRRYHADLYVGLPGDFYAGAYGQATIFLDAAYTEAVKPGSHIDVYANGFVAANLPLASDSGDIFRHLPVKVALTHFRPGVNHVAVEAVLDTEADAVCAPGAASGGPDRFAIFDTSEFFMPDFARIDRWPDLSALAGTGSPYAGDEGPVQVVLGRGDDTVYSAAATLLSRLAIASGRLIPTDLGSPGLQPTRPAIFVGALDQFSAPTLAELGVDAGAQSSWVRQVRGELSGLPVTIDPGNATAAFGDAQTTNGLYNRWRKELVQPGGVQGTWYAFQDWLERTFDLSFSSLRIMSAEDRPFAPPDRASLFVAEAPAAADRSWTMVAAPTEDDLLAGVNEITAMRYWPTLDGRVASFDAATGVAGIPAQSQRFILGRGFSLQNMRLVAANWLSVNIVVYAFALVILCGVVGACTSALLARLGRRS